MQYRSPYLRLLRILSTSWILGVCSAFFFLSTENTINHKMERNKNFGEETWDSKIKTFFIFPFACLVHSYFLKCLEYRSATLKLVNPSSTRITIHPHWFQAKWNSQKQWQILKVLWPSVVIDCFWHEFSLTLALLIKLWGFFESSSELIKQQISTAFPMVFFLFVSEPQSPPF